MHVGDTGKTFPNFKVECSKKTCTMQLVLLISSKKPPSFCTLQCSRHIKPIFGFLTDFPVSIIHQNPKIRFTSFEQEFSHGKPFLSKTSSDNQCERKFIHSGSKFLDFLTKQNSFELFTCCTEVFQVTLK